ncbi:MAG: helix-hairpin-helix domain-containing protein [Nitrospirota bacterium]|nr:helix-hairpin-helix domain-containing protein [Nitrospirota bacterium]MDH5585966.1 helix-hairpin-helix domain-containing protein [Nitrospirota bacterium]
MQVKQGRGEWSWGKSLLLKISILGLGISFVLWTGWPHPQARHDDRAHPSSVAHQASTIQSFPSSSTLEAGAGTFDPLKFPAGQGEKKSLPTMGTTLLVDLNLGSRLELETLPGIGMTLADRIVAYRSRHGDFKHVQDLGKVEGIGEKRFKRLEPFVTVQSNTEARAS